jgi:predicted membrane protein (TIGR00267 family)
VVPFLFPTGHKAIITSAGLVIVMVFITGIYLGKISKRNILLSALKMAIFGIAVAVAV